MRLLRCTSRPLGGALGSHITLHQQAREGYALLELARARFPRALVLIKTVAKTMIIRTNFGADNLLVHSRTCSSRNDPCHLDNNSG
jgi:hypothetical protein